MASAMIAFRARSYAAPVTAALVAITQIGAAPVDQPTPYERLARAVIADGPATGPLSDPSDVLDMLSGDPVARAIRAEAAAAALRRMPSRPAAIAPDASAELDPIIAAKVSSALSLLSASPAAGPAVDRFDFGRFARRHRAARPPRFARRASAPSADVQSAIYGAAQRTGAPYTYLWRAAARESSFDPHADAATSTAFGLYQFLEKTWLLTMRRHGHKHGLGHYASLIAVDGRGEPVVRSARDRAVILALRADPDISALLAGEFTQDNRRQLRAALRREPREGELYAAHFLGAGGAIQLLAAARQTPARSAAGMFPVPASRNRSIFYQANGRARSTSELAALLIRKGERA
jgi:hypothetical protein